MARDLCIEFPNAFYHIFSRGINRQDLFCDDKDSEFFISLLRKAKYRFNLRIFAFCLMTNHYHLYLCTPDANISKAIKYLNETYARYFLKKYPEKDGHVFKGRYKRKIVQDDLYSLNLISYIHNNPKTADLISRLQDWKYSSYRTFVCPEAKLDFIDYDWVLNQFGLKEQAINNFVKYHDDEYQPNWDPEELAKAGIFLADDEFIITTCEQYIQLQPANISKIKGYKDLVKLLQSTKLLKAIETLTLPDRLKEKLIIYMLKEYSSLSLKEIGAKLSKTTMAVSKSCTRFKADMKNSIWLKPIVKELIKMSNV